MSHKTSQEKDGMKLAECLCFCFFSSVLKTVDLILYQISQVKGTASLVISGERFVNTENGRDTVTEGRDVADEAVCFPHLSNKTVISTVQCIFCVHFIFLICEKSVRCTLYTVH